MGSMAVGIARRSELDGVVDRSETCLVTLGEESSTDQLPVTVTSRESGPTLAGPFPPSRDWAQVQIGKTPALRPNPRVEDSDDNVGAVVGFGPETTLVSEAEKLRGAGGVKRTATVLEDGEHGGVLAERGNLLVGEHSREALENGVVEMEDASGFSELRCVPVVVGREDRGLGLVINPENECFGVLIPR